MCQKKNCYYAIPWVEDPRRKIRFFLHKFKLDFKKTNSIYFSLKSYLAIKSLF